MARPLVLAAAIVASLLAVSGAGGGATQQTPKRGGTVVVWAPVEPACLNWLLSCGNSAATSAVLDEVLEGAFAIGPRHYVPALVSPHVEITRKKPFTITLHIREAARWSDGVPVTAADFTFTEAMIRRDVAPDTDNSQLRYQRTAVRAVTALDSKTVRVVLNARSAGWRDLFAVLLPRHALARTDETKIWLSDIDDPQHGSTDRERSLPRRLVAARQAAHTRSKSPVLGSASRVSRSHRPPLRHRARRRSRRAARG